MKRTAKRAQEETMCYAFFNYLQIEQFRVMISSLLDDFAIKIFLFIFRSRQLLAIKIIRKLFGSGQCRDLVFSRWRRNVSDGRTPGQTRSALNLIQNPMTWWDFVLFTFINCQCIVTIRNWGQNSVNSHQSWWNESWHFFLSQTKTFITLHFRRPLNKHSL